jgi:hypothetical protein
MPVKTLQTRAIANRALKRANQAFESIADLSLKIKGFHSQLKRVGILQQGLLQVVKQERRLSGADIALLRQPAKSNQIPDRVTSIRVERCPSCQAHLVSNNETCPECGLQLAKWDTPNRPNT